MIQTSAGIPSEVRERIVSVAAELFEQSGRQAMPTVDAVRRVARVDMNAASAVMKAGRSLARCAMANRMRRRRGWRRTTSPSIIPSPMAFCPSTG